MGVSKKYQLNFVHISSLNVGNCTEKVPAHKSKGWFTNIDDPATVVVTGIDNKLAYNFKFPGHGNLQRAVFEALPGLLKIENPYYKLIVHLSIGSTYETSVKAIENAIQNTFAEEGELTFVYKNLHSCEYAALQKVYLSAK